MLCVCVCVCARACVRACVRACARARAYVYIRLFLTLRPIARRNLFRNAKRWSIFKASSSSYCGTSYRIASIPQKPATPATTQPQSPSKNKQEVMSTSALILQQRPWLVIRTKTNNLAYGPNKNHIKEMN